MEELSLPENRDKRIEVLRERLAKDLKARTEEGIRDLVKFIFEEDEEISVVVKEHNIPIPSYLSISTQYESNDEGGSYLSIDYMYLYDQDKNEIDYCDFEIKVGTSAYDFYDHIQDSLRDNLYNYMDEIEEYFEDEYMFDVR